MFILPIIVKGLPYSEQHSIFNLTWLYNSDDLTYYLIHFTNV